MKIKINEKKRFQTLTGFGVSGAWWAQFVGGWTDTDEESGLEKRERIAQLLFDNEQGIGISQYRYNIGAGSADSNAGRYSTDRRRTRGLEKAPGVYDWSNDANAVWFMYAAKKYGVDEITLFVNSPPERLTKNHKAYLDTALKTNLSRKNFDEFAKYCLDITEHFVNEGLPIKYISPVNEPVWVWLENQEGCHYRPCQVYALMKVFAKALDAREGLKGVKLAGAENGDIRWFNKTYSHIMLRNPFIRSKVDGVDIHSYCMPTPKIPILNKPLNDRLAYAKRYRKWMDRHYPDAPVKISEWCHMQGGRDYGMNSALEQAKIMAEDLTVMNAVSWQLWVGLSEVDYCDGIIYYFDENGENAFKLTKRYYAFGNFSKYIKRGSVRIDARIDCENAYAVAFDCSDEIAVIIINFSEKAEECSIDFGEKSAVMYVTDEENSLDKHEIDNLGSFSVSAKSVNTVIIKK